MNKVVLRYLDDEGHMMTLRDDYAEQSPEVAVAPKPEPVDDGITLKPGLCNVEKAETINVVLGVSPTYDAARAMKKQLFGGTMEAKPMLGVDAFMSEGKKPTKVRVRRMAPGTEVLIGDFLLNEIQNHGGWFDFAVKVIQPNYGSGKYEPTMLYDDGSEGPRGVYGLPTTKPTPTPEPEPFAIGARVRVRRGVLSGWAGREGTRLASNGVEFSPGCVRHFKDEELEAAPIVKPRPFKVGDRVRANATARREFALLVDGFAGVVESIDSYDICLINGKSVSAQYLEIDAPRFVSGDRVRHEATGRLGVIARFGPEGSGTVAVRWDGTETACWFFENVLEKVPVPAPEPEPETTSPERARRATDDRTVTDLKVGDRVRVTCNCGCVFKGRLGTIDHIFTWGGDAQVRIDDIGKCTSFMCDVLEKVDAEIEPTPTTPEPAPKPAPRCLRCGGPAYVGLFSAECLRSGGCKTVEERVGEPRLMPDDRSGGALNWDIFSSKVGRDHPETGWYAAGAGDRGMAAGPFVTRELAVAAWKEKRAAGYRFADDTNWISGAWPPATKPNPLLSATIDPKRGPESNDPMAAYMPYLS